MTKIDFHTQVSDKIGYTCRLVRKALATSAGSRIVILVENRAQLASLDEMLWTFSDSDFLPHATATETLAEALRSQSTACRREPLALLP